MKIQVKDRGWLWEDTEKETAWNKCWCPVCHLIRINPSNISDSKKCPQCSGLMFRGSYMKKVKEVKL